MLNGNNHLEDVGQPSVAEVEAEVEEEWIEVPYEYEVEEIKEQPGGFKEEVVERSVPQIKALYSYKGNGMEAVKGEVSKNVLFLMGFYCCLAMQCLLA